MRTPCTGACAGPQKSDDGRTITPAAAARDAKSAAVHLAWAAAARPSARRPDPAHPDPPTPPAPRPADPPPAPEPRGRSIAIAGPPSSRVTSPLSRLRQAHMAVLRGDAPRLAHPLGADQHAEAQARGDDLRQAADMPDPLGRQGAQAGGRIGTQAGRIAFVLDDLQVVTAGPPRRCGRAGRPPSTPASGSAPGVRHTSRAPGAGDAVQILGDHALIIQRHRLCLGAHQACRVSDAGIGQRLDHDLRGLIRQAQRHDQRDRVLTAVRQDHVVVGHRPQGSDGHPVQCRAPAILVAAERGVIQDRRVHVRRHRRQMRGKDPRLTAIGQLRDAQVGRALRRCGVVQAFVQQRLRHRATGARRGDEAAASHGLMTHLRRRPSDRPGRRFRS